MDSGNILSILNFLGSQGAQQPPGADAPDVQLPGVANNVLQAAAPQQPPPPQIPAPPQVVPPQAVAQAAVAASAPMPKPRHSLADIIGHLADGIAQAGGATPMYQRTLDAMQEHATKVDMDKLDLATKQAALTGTNNTNAADERTRFTNVLDAVNDPEDAAKLPQMMEAAGLTDPRYAPFIKMVQEDPDQAKVLSSALGGGGDDENKLGKNLYFGTDTAGKTVAYQIGPDGKPHILDFGGNVTPSTPIKVVNTGDKNVIVGQNGQPLKILPNTVSPNTAATTNTSRDNNIRTNTTNLTIAGMPARAKSADGKASDPGAGLKIISDIQQSFDRLHQLQALPGEGGAVGNAIGMFGRTALGQAIEAKTGLSPAAQQRELLAKNLANLQSDLLKTLPGNATRTRFEQEIQRKRLPDPTTMNYDTANQAIAQIRDAYMTALNSQPQGKSNLPTLSPTDAAKLAPGTSFRTLDGRILVRH